MNLPVSTWDEKACANKSFEICAYMFLFLCTARTDPLPSRLEPATRHAIGTEYCNNFEAPESTSFNPLPSYMESGIHNEHATVSDGDTDNKWRKEPRTKIFVWSPPRVQNYTPDTPSHRQ